MIVTKYPCCNTYNPLQANTLTVFLFTYKILTRTHNPHIVTISL